MKKMSEDPNLEENLGDYGETLFKLMREDLPKADKLNLLLYLGFGNPQVHNPRLNKQS